MSKDWRHGRNTKRTDFASKKMEFKRTRPNRVHRVDRWDKRIARCNEAIKEAEEK